MSKPAQRVHIVGTGIMGLSLGIKILEYNPKLKLIFYESPLTPGASSIASGLLHGFHGPSMQRTTWAPLGITLFKQHVASLTSEHGQTPLLPNEIYTEKRLWRPLWREKQIPKVQALAYNYPHELSLASIQQTQFLNANNTGYNTSIRSAHQKIFPYEVALNTSCLQVNTSVYLNTMRQFLKSKGADFVVKKVCTNQFLHCNEYCFICTGADLAKWIGNVLSDTQKDPRVHSLQNSHAVEFLKKTSKALYQTSGELLAWQGAKSPLLERLALNSRYYCLMQPQSSTLPTGCYRFLFGSTFVRTSTAQGLDFYENKHALERAKLLENCRHYQDLLSLENTFPQRVGASRLHSSEHLPVAVPLSSRVLGVGALGSKGLLSHLILAKTIAQIFRATNEKPNNPSPCLPFSWESDDTLKRLLSIKELFNV